MIDLKKLVAVILALTMAFSLAAPAAFAVDGKCDCGENPIIYVGPLGNSDIYENPDSEEERTLFRPSTGAIITLVLKLLPALPSLLLFKNYDRFGDVLIDAVYDAFGAMALDGNGDSLENVAVKPDPLPTDPTHGEGYDYYFSYDWRLDPVEIAGQFNEFVEHVKTLTGHDKVNLRASSMGGVVTMAYFREYGYDDVDACVFQCCPILGTDVAGDLLSRKLALDSKALLDYASDGIPPFDFGGAALNVLFDVLYYSGLVDTVYGFAGKLLDNLQERVFDELLTPVFGTLLGLWSFVPDSSYEEAKKINLDPETQAGLIAKADYYHYEVQCKADEILNGAVDNGVRVMIVAGYDIQRTPLVENMDNNSDATVDTKYASAGATVALLGETLGEDYEQKNCDCGHNHVSPDGVIDASTCILPEHTWFIKGMLHSNCHDGIMEMYNWFMYSGEDCNVWSNPKFTQFLENDKPNLRVKAMGNFAEGAEQPTYEPGNSFYDKYSKYAAPVFDAITGVLDKLRAA